MLNCQFFDSNTPYRYLTVAFAPVRAIIDVSRKAALAARPARAPVTRRQRDLGAQRHLEYTKTLRHAINSIKRCSCRNPRIQYTKTYYS